MLLKIELKKIFLNGIKIIFKMELKLILFEISYKYFDFKYNGNFGFQTK